jgi:hypothetical protein
MTYPFVEQDLVIYQGETLRQPMVFSQVPSIGGTKTPIDLTGCTITMTIAWNAGTWGSAGTAVKSSPASGITITSAVNGTAEALYSAANLASVPAGRNARWKIQLTLASGDVRVFGAGDVNVKTVP